MYDRFVFLDKISNISLLSTEIFITPTLLNGVIAEILRSQSIVIQLIIYFRIACIVYDYANVRGAKMLD